MLKSSTPTSRAPSAARKLAGRRPSKTRSPYAKSWRIAAPVRRAYSTAAAKAPGGVAGSNGLLQLRQAGERRVAVDVGSRRRLGQRLHHVRRRPDLGVAAAEIDQRLAPGGRSRRNARQEIREV